ncbi:MAG: hypothetical protein GY777_28995 [Candidatus Brocadiaceae bacterium]|nr:hypothetical protein [Candidatus Brocadiaceae bacterium]
MAYRLTRGQGIFTLQEHAHSYPLHILAQNIDLPSVVLEWPSLEDLKKELKGERYDYVCITFMSRDLNKLRTMSDLIREYSPKSKIVIGGYGVVCMSDGVEKEFEGTYDYICRKEGISYMRSLLKEKIDKPICCRLPQGGSTIPWLSTRSRGTVGALLAGLGCTNRCPFCITSFYTNGNYLTVMNPDQLYNGMVKYWKTNPFTISVNIYGENFLDYEEDVKKLGRLIRDDTNFGLKKLNYFTFGSVNAICKFDPEELLLSGLDTVWIGVESLYANLEKLNGYDIKKVFQSMNGIGIKTIGSWMCGLDSQEQNNIEKDEDYLISLNPSFQQISILTDETSMPWIDKRKKNNGRLYPWENFHLYGKTFEPRNFTYEQLLDRIENVYDKMYQVNGPSIMRMLQTNMNGYKYCKKSKHILLKNDKAHFFRQRIDAYSPLLKACIEFAPSERVKNLLKELESEIVDHFGPFTIGQKDFHELILRKAVREHELRKSSEPSIKQEDLRRYVYPSGTKNQFRRKPYTVTYPHLKSTSPALV